MNKIFKKGQCVKGFTVLEAIIGMILTGLLVVFALSAIRYYRGFFYRITTTGNRQSEINLFQSTLAHDVLKAEKVFFDTGLTCQSSESTICYTFSKEYIVRNSVLSVDTFFIRHNIPVVTASPEVPELAGEIRIDCFNKDLNFVVDAYKKYPLGLTFETLK